MSCLVTFTNPRINPPLWFSGNSLVVGTILCKRSRGNKGTNQRMNSSWNQRRGITTMISPKSSQVFSQTLWSIWKKGQLYSGFNGKSMPNASWGKYSTPRKSWCWITCRRRDFTLILFMSEWCVVSIDEQILPEIWAGNSSCPPNGCWLETQWFRGL